ncbi:hypothetical protein pqer_cds_492 [Pandoravirus quercus]|uniref:Uncharacterized protein n=2 Tax=Pandoravirus TaxID=2060084 RepID=A0A2U7U8Z7_9VIRU|nr:hypothetical protein pqer_cds_492 [Pandoravirus quercus]AVK74914.1 hypothetical protein pqer_cds_492 [Pandoravirus quercus]QBZ81100.1 hypothetical protein pclt_cds_506 [Pandoravirus celtis]
MTTTYPSSVMRPAVLVTSVLMALVCAASVSAAYQPTDSPILSVGDLFAIYSVHYQSFCYWQGYDPQATYDWESIKCNVAKPLLSQASRFIMGAPYPRQMCGRVPLSPSHNISVAFSVRRPLCEVPDPVQKCAVNNPRGGATLINCGPYDDPVEASLVLTNTVAPPNGVDGWLHGGETPVAITSVGASAACAVDSGVGRILCPAPVPAVGPDASVFYLVPLVPEPDYGC